jgi:amino acid transporter
VGPERIAEDPAVAFAPLAADTFGAGADVVIALLIIAFILIINTAILGSARTLFQASVDGYTIKGLDKLSKRRVPTRAMGFDIGVNLLLMLLGTPISILAASTVGYMITNILDLSGGWLLDKDTRKMQVPYRAPRAIMRAAPVLAGFNFLLLFAGGPSWGWGAVALGWGIVLLSIPLYLYRQWADNKPLIAAVEPEAEVASA